jgi:hypothetical protein
MQPPPPPSPIGGGWQQVDYRAWRQGQMGAYAGMIVGLFGLMAANGLRQLKRYGGIIGIVLGVIGFCIGFMMFTDLHDHFSLGLISLPGALTILLIVLSWKSLT